MVVRHFLGKSDSPPGRQKGKQESVSQAGRWAATGSKEKKKTLTKADLVTGTMHY